MSLLALEAVCKRFARGPRERYALSGVSLAVEAGELVGILGRRRSGRTTLLQVAAGIEPPSAGTVSFDGVSLAQRPMLGEPGGIAYPTTTFPDAVATSVVEHVAAPLLGRGVSLGMARGRAHELLRRVEATSAIGVAPHGLDATEAIRVGLARALATRPRIMLVDDPLLGVRLADRDGVLALLASLAHHDGIGVVITLDNGAALAGCDRAATLDMGELRGETVPVSAPVIPLERRRADSSA